MAGPLLVLPGQLRGGARRAVGLHRAAARRARGHGDPGGGRRGRARSCSAPGWRRWCASATSPGGAGSSGRWCCRWRCPATCSRCSRSAARDDLGATWIPLRSPGGAVVIFTLVLYPYVYLLARTAFLAQGADLVEAARGLGLSRARGDPAGGGADGAAGDPRRRGAGADGVAGRLRHGEPARACRRFTNAIYKVWFGAFDRDAALQLGMLLVSVTLMLLAARAGVARPRPLRERGRRRRAPEPVRLRGRAGGAARCSARSRCWRWWSGRRWRSSRSGRCESLSDGLLPTDFGLAARNSLLLAGMSVAARGGRGAGAGLRAPRRPLARRRGRGARGHDRLRAARLGGGGGRDRAARLDRPPPRRRRGRRPPAHRHRDRAVRTPTWCASSRSPSSRSTRAWSGCRARSTRPRAAWAPTASTCSPACTCR